MKIFLSYASEHREIAERICLKLVNASHDVFFDRQDLQPGRSFDLKIREEVDRCDLFVFLLSPESIEPGSYALTEVDLVQRKWPDPEGRVLVVDLGLLRGETIPPYLRANIHLSPKGDPATETLFAVQGMANVQPSSLSSKKPVHGTADHRRWVLTAVVALVAASGLWAAYHSSQKPDTQVIQATNGGVAAGGGITVGGNIDINKGETDSSPKSAE